MSDSSTTTSASLGVGGSLAAVISWSLCPHVGWLLLHTIGGWVYIIWKLLDGTIPW